MSEEKEVSYSQTAAETEINNLDDPSLWVEKEGIIIYY